MKDCCCQDSHGQTDSAMSWWVKHTITNFFSIYSFILILDMLTFNIHVLYTFAYNFNIQLYKHITRDLDISWNVLNWDGQEHGTNMDTAWNISVVCNGKRYTCTLPFTSVSHAYKLRNVTSPCHQHKIQPLHWVKITYLVHQKCTTCSQHIYQ